MLNYRKYGDVVRKANNVHEKSLKVCGKNKIAWFDLFNLFFFFFERFIFNVCVYFCMLCWHMCMDTADVTGARRGCRIPWNWVFFMSSRFLTAQSSARANCTHTLVIQQHSCYFHRFGFCFEQRPWYVVQVNLKHHLTGLKFTVISPPHLPRTEISDCPSHPVCLSI